MSFLPPAFLCHVYAKRVYRSLARSLPRPPPPNTQVSGTPAVHPSEIIVTLAYGDVEMYAKSGGQEPTATDFDWKGGRVLRLPGWSVPHEGDTVVVMVNATSDARYRVLAASDEDVLRLEDGIPVQMIQDESEMRYVWVVGTLTTGTREDMRPGR